MRLLRDRLFKFESSINWFEAEYLENIKNKRQKELSKGKPAKPDTEYFVNGKNLFSILSAKFESNGNSRKEFREKICSIIIDYLDASEFESQLGEALSQIFKS